MDWDAIAAIAGITASAGVMVSLIYPGLQIRSPLVESRLESGDELSRQSCWTTKKDLHCTEADDNQDLPCPFTLTA